MDLSGTFVRKSVKISILLSGLLTQIMTGYLLKRHQGSSALLRCPAKFTGIDSVPGSSSSRFTWTPCYEAVRSQPYNIIFKSDDNNSEIKLSDIDNMTIKVLGPSPELISAYGTGEIH